MTDETIIKDAILAHGGDQGKAQHIATAIARYCEANYRRKEGTENSSRAENEYNFSITEALKETGRDALCISKAITTYCKANYAPKHESDSPTSRDNSTNHNQVDKNDIKQALIDAGWPSTGGYSKIANAIHEYCDANFVRKNEPDNPTRQTEL